MLCNRKGDVAPRRRLLVEARAVRPRFEAGSWTADRWAHIPSKMSRGRVSKALGVGEVGTITGKIFLVQEGARAGQSSGPSDSAL